MTVRRSRSGLLVIELIIAVGVFSLCAAICVGLFVQADTISRESAALGQAVSLSQNTAERYKTVGGDLEQLAHMLNTSCGTDGTLEIAFDQDWQPTQEQTACYRLTIIPQSAEGLHKAELCVQDTQTGQTLLALPLAAEVQA